MQVQVDRNLTAFYGISLPLMTSPTHEDLVVDSYQSTRHMVSWSHPDELTV